MPIMMLIVEILLIIMGIRWKTWKQTENCREKQKIPAANGKLAAGKLKTFWKQQKKVEIFAEKLQNRTAGESKPSPNHLTKKSNRLKTVGHLYKMRFKNDTSILLFLHDTTKKKAHDIFFVMGLWRKERDSNPWGLYGPYTISSRAP